MTDALTHRGTAWQAEFAGRAGELVSLRGRPDAARGGRGGPVPIVGEVGIGKTALARRNSPDYSFCINAREETLRSLKRLLDGAAQRLHFGHGQPADATSVRRRFAKALARAPQTEDEAPPQTGGNRQRGCRKTQAGR